jgi:hypothetical protein
LTANAFPQRHDHLENGKPIEGVPAFGADRHEFRPSAGQ